ncbi:MAG: metal ABC transporter permease [Paracoccaceae bacterium]|nr:metal ABC transporter permease [Paracoccaceae bacterium]
MIDFATITMPFNFNFMVNAFVISLLISVPTGLLSCFLVMKGWALMGDAISHAVLPGIVLAYICGVPLIVGAFLSGILCAVLTGFLSDNSRVKPDTVMGVVFSGMFGVGMVLYASVRSNIHLDHILFGNILGVETDELILVGILAIGVSLVIIIKWKDLLLYTFDPIQAKSSGLSVNWLYYGLLTVLSMTVVTTLAATGLILAIGLLIAPGAIAFLIVRSFSAMLWLSVIICMTSMLIGIYISFFLDSAPAPTVVLTLTGVFIIVFIRKMLLGFVKSRNMSGQVS